MTGTTPDKKSAPAQSIAAKKQNKATPARAHPRLAGAQAVVDDVDSPFVMAYLRFLSRIETAQKAQDAADEKTLSPNEKALLELVVLRWAKRAPLTVRQAIAHTYMGSPATLHKRLVQLRQKEFLELEDVARDKRIKYLVPGPRGLAYVAHMGRHLMGARRSPSTPEVQGADAPD